MPLSNRGRYYCENEDRDHVDKCENEVALKIESSPSYPKLLRACKRFFDKKHNLMYEDQVNGIIIRPWTMLEMHGRVYKGKSTQAKTLRRLADEVFAQTGLPRCPEGKFRGDNGVDWENIFAQKEKSCSQS